MSEMILRHFSFLPVLSVNDVEQVNPENPIIHHTKPNGLWVSDEAAEQSWSSWCEAEQYERAPLEHNVVLADNARICYINSVAELDDFADAYGQKPTHHLFRNEPSIRWADVADDFDGIIITPYQWERRLHRGSSWYYGWDCASGCIWRGRAVASIEPTVPLQVVAAILDAALAKAQPQKE
jgi:hypothetical protein